jgi:hypothetical protein
MWLKDVFGMFTITKKLSGLVVLSLCFFTVVATAAMPFPTTRETNDADDILNTYVVYLNFVLEVGRETNSAEAQRLADTYQKLRRVHPVGAARFLKGLRFEMTEKLQLAGIAPSNASSRSGEMHRWVNKFLRDWTREADEHLFRAVAIASARRK